jgi:lipoprotein-anchoring transpeptidase ErfK/SrfK
MRLLVNAAAVSALFLGVSGCVISETDKASDTSRPAAGDTAATATPAIPPQTALPDPDMRIEVDLAARKLYVIRGGARVATHSVAVGSQKWPTQTGEWKIVQTVWNPEWTPPDESWAEEREPRKPGDPKNPLGRIQLVYDPPRSIHGTNQPSSIGKAVSHGSIRVTNEVGEQLAREVMEAGGAPKDEAWYASARANRTEKQIVDLPQPIPIRVY